MISQKEIILRHSSQFCYKNKTLKNKSQTKKKTLISKTKIIFYLIVTMKQLIQNYSNGKINILKTHLSHQIRFAAISEKRFLKIKFLSQKFTQSVSTSYVQMNKFYMLLKTKKTMKVFKKMKTKKQNLIKFDFQIFYPIGIHQINKKNMN